MKKWLEPKTKIYRDGLILSIPRFRLTGDERRSQPQIMACALAPAYSALVVDLRGGDVPLAEHVLHFVDVHALIEQQGSRKEWSVNL